MARQAARLLGQGGLPGVRHALWAWVAEALQHHEGAQPLVACWHAEAAGPTYVLAAAPDGRFQIDTLLQTCRQQAGAVQAYGHRVVNLTREGTGGDAVLQVRAAPARRATLHDPKAWMWFVAEVPSLEPAAAQALAETLRTRLGLAAAVVKDFPAMRDQLAALARTLLGGAQAREARQFCAWLAEDHFVFLGYRRYSYTGRGKGRAVQAVPRSGLGILRHRPSTVKQATPLAGHDALPQYAQESKALMLSKTPDLAPLHRLVPMDYVALLERDAHGWVVAEHRFLGLLTSSAYTEGVRTTPLLRRKVQEVRRRCLALAGWRAEGHQARMLQNVLETWPRDELFLADEETLARQAVRAVGARMRHDTTLLLRLSPREQAATALVLLPLGRMSTRLRTQIGEVLAAALGPQQEFKVELGEGELARLQFRCRWEGQPVEDAALEAQLQQLVRGWDDEVADALAAHDPARARVLALLGGSGAAYRAQTAPQVAVADARTVLAFLQGEPAGEGQGPVARVALAEGTTGGVEIRVTSRQPVALGPSVTLLESCGLTPLAQEQHQLEGVYVQVLHVARPAGPTPTAAQLQALTATLQACLRQEAEVDPLNHLALSLALQPADLMVLRALAAVTQQLQRALDPARTQAMLAAAPELAGALLKVFKARLQPRVSAACKAEARQALAQLEQAIQDLPTLEAEQRWRTVLGVVQACVRTNLWRLSPGEALALKYEPAEIPHVPTPHPWREIFVYHPDVEGVHLRGGPVARGGLRHSNRGTDYRTEVLGLMTAQMRKNTIIVPVGAKGGFYVRRPEPEGMRPKLWAEHNYRRYIRALLSVTDTLDAHRQPVAPVGVRCRDGADPYLVVAADKGTATFSDVANEEAAQAAYWGLPQPGFWLGDAFASGGSAGYDHKALGITARGAWISVLHHAAALGLTPRAERPLRLVGIGDMGGDVFGNGLLLSPHVALVAAFNHSHIFLDPAPEPATSYAERRRCFAAGLGWEGYDTSKLSAGGGVFPRSAKTIKLSAAAQQALGLKGRGRKPLSMAPDAVIQAILAAPVDGLWNGGIGTYIKASDEAHAAAADKVNDTTRIDARQVRCAIIGEGGNLGLTARARVELARRGVRLNTDAVDNSAGVDTSDHEVNLKILLGLAEQEGRLDRPGRDKLLRQLTDEVARLVLRDNVAQNLLISLEADAKAEDHLELATWQEQLIRLGYADPAVDCLPARKDLQARPEGRYTRPELAALMAATKAWLREELQRDEGLLASPVAAPLLRWYFPKPLRAAYADLMARHPLASHILATELTNLIVNRLGLLAVPRLMEDYSTTAGEAARALGLACCVTRLTKLWRQLDELLESEAPLSGPAQLAAYGRLRLVANFLGAWVLRHGQPVDVAGWWEALFAPVGEALTVLPKLLDTRPEIQAWQQEWRQQGVPEGVAASLALLSPLAVVPDAVLVARETKTSLQETLKVQLQIGVALQLPALVAKIRTMALPDAFTRQAVQALVMELFMRQRRLTEARLRKQQKVEAWLGECGPVCGRYTLLVRQLLREKHLSVAMLTLLLARLRELEG